MTNDELQVGLETLQKMPHNMLRKAFALKASIRQLEDLQRRYMPIFDNDTVINNVLEQMRSEVETIMAELRVREDAKEAFETLFDKE